MINNDKVIMWNLKNIYSFTEGDIFQGSHYEKIKTLSLNIDKND